MFLTQAVVVIVILAVVERNGLRDSPGIVLGWWVAVLVAVGLLNRRRQRPEYRLRVVTKAFETRGMLDNPVHGEVSGSGIRLSSRRGTDAYTWPDIRSVLETDDYFVLIARAVNAKGLLLRLLVRLGQTLVLPIPKRAVPDPAQLAELRALLGAHNPIRTLTPEPRAAARPAAS
jgi:hypothetical protein